MGRALAITAGKERDLSDRCHIVKDFGSNPNSFHRIMSDLEKKNKTLEEENKKLKRILSIEQSNRRKLERRLRINKRETQRLTLENQQLRRQI